MIYFYYGKNPKQKEKALRLFESLKQKKPDATFLSFDEENINEGVLIELTESQGLFEKKIVGFFSRILENKEHEDAIIFKIKELSETQNIFIWYEEDLKKEELSALKKFAEKSDVEENAKLAFGQAGEFNMFSLADAFGKKDKKNLWILFNKAREKSSAEEIHGILFWQLKAMAVAQIAKTAEEADLKPFVFSKAKTFAKNFSEKEIKNLMDKFVEMYHEAHRGKEDFMTALEKMILEL